MIEIVSESERDTQKIGFFLGKFLISQDNFHTEQKVFALQGDLGGGKTTFLKGVAKGLGVKERVVSPTFIIFKKFQIPRSHLIFYHFDCYRIKGASEIKRLGFDKILQNPALIFVEWGEKIKNLLPKETVWIKFKIENFRKRKIKISNLKKGENFLQYIKTKDNKK